MNNLINESWGKLTVDEKNNRLVMILHDCSSQQFNQMMDESLKAVTQHKLETCICDPKDRTNGTQSDVEYSGKKMKAAFEKGLKRLAIVEPESQNEKELVQSFVSQSDQNKVRTFSTTQEAINWLDGTASQRKAA